MRDLKTRKADAKAALESQGHYWLATADAGKPHAIGVSAWWSDGRLVVTTLGTSRTARNLETNRRAVLTHGDPSDAVVVQAEVVESSPAGQAQELARGFKAVMGWEPGEKSGWTFFRLRPTRIQAFRGYDEIEGRDVMKDGRWLA